MDEELSFEDEQTVPPDEVSEGRPETAFLRIVNDAGVEVRDIAIIQSGAGDWSENILDGMLEPGAGALDDFVADPESWDYPFTQDRDLIFIDQRGTGYSTPTLDCPELSDGSDGDDENPERICHARLESAGVDHTASIAPKMRPTSLPCAPSWDTRNGTCWEFLMAPGWR